MDLLLHLFRYLHNMGNNFRDLESNGMDGSMFHYLGDAQWDYFEQLRLAASSSMRVSPIVRAIYEDTSKRRRENVMLYKNFNYQIEGDTFIVY